MPSINTKFIFSIATVLSSLFLVACGGGDSKTAISTPASEPIKISSTSWKKHQSLSKQTIAITTKVNHARPFLDINVSGLNLATNDHWQIFLDLDNDPTTGFQFNNEAWSYQSGIDYLIEDGSLYKSTANNTSWSWKHIGPVIKSSYTQGKLFARISVKQHKGLCKNFKIGVIKLDKDWNIDNFYPSSSSLLPQTTFYCNPSTVNHPPVIHLKGNPTTVTVNQGAIFVDPGTTASDLEDGDISSSVTIDYSDVNTAVPNHNYTVVYTVVDSQGLRVYKNRRVIVKDKLSTGILIDGKNSDWAAISPLAQNTNGTIKVTDNKNYYYILVDANSLGENWEIFLDADNKSNTGYKLQQKGADFLLENFIFSKFSGQNQNQWAWQYDDVSIVQARENNTLEIAIPKSALSNLKNISALTFVSIDNNWNISYQLPNAFKTYSLKFPVTPVNTAPIAKNDNVSTNNATNIVINALANDSDPDGDTLTITNVSTPVNGTPSIVGNKIKFIPNAGFVGAVTFTYTINDGHGHTAIASVRVNVTSSNRPPVAVKDTTATNNASSKLINVLSNDTDPDNDPLIITQVSNPANGTTSIVTNKINFVPKPNFVGTVSFNYTISDGKGHTANAVVTVNVTSSNRAPVAVNDTATTNNTTAITINTLANDTDADNDTLSITQVSNPSNGTAGIVANKIRFVPKANFVGSVVFTYTISDGHAHNATATVTVNVSSSNLAPIATNDAASVLNTSSVIIHALNNDTDPDADALTITQVSNPTNGTASIVANKVKYVPAANFRGINTITYTISDGHGHTANAVISITVTGVNRAPNAVEDSPTTNHTVPILINILQNDTDPDGDTLTVTSISQPPAGTTATLNANGTVLFDPKGHVGSHAFSYIISDGHGGTDTAVVTIATSDPNGGHENYPNISNENITTPKNTAIFINVLANDTDADGDVLILDQVDWGDHGVTTKVNGGVLYTPDAGYTGTDLFYYGVHDGYGHNGTGIVSITITP